MDEEEIDFKVEAEAVIEDIGFTVKSISVSRKLPSSRECVYLNVLTKECKSMCIELSVLGFRVSYVFISQCLSYSSLCAISLVSSCYWIWQLVLDGVGDMDVGYKASDPGSKHHSGVFLFHFYITQ